MPGFNIIYRHEPIDNELTAKANLLLEKMRYFPHYSTESKCIGRNLLAGAVLYPGYPLSYKQSGNVHCFIEGFIYGKGKEGIDALIRQIAADPSGRIWKDREKLKNLLINTDGEFAVVVANSETGDTYIFNDALGRITYYFYQRGDTFILAREPKFIAGLAPTLTISSSAMAEAMLFFFPLGSRTIFEEIKKLAPASLIRLSPRARRIEIGKTIEWNFSEGQVDDDPGRYAEGLLDPFLQSCRARVEAFRDRTNILTLSGGLDSRTVLAGFKKYDTDLKLITFVDQRGALLRDLPVAQELARAYGMETRRIDLPGVNIDDMNRLINMKDGHGVGGIAGTVMKSLDILSADYGPGCAFFTGDGGGLILAPRCQKLRLESADDLATQLIRRNTVFSLDEAAAVTRTMADELRERLRGHFMAYPESTLRDKYGHFSIFEHLFRLSFEGEDRVRFFFWSNTPFYGMPFFHKAMMLSDRSKEYHRLFAEFHLRLDPRIARIKYANWGFPVASAITPAYLFLKNWTIDRPGIEKAVRRVINMKRLLARRGRVELVDQDAQLLKRSIGEILERNPGVNNYLDTKRIFELLPRWNNHLQLYSISNIVTYLTNLIKMGIKPGLNK